MLHAFSLSPCQLRVKAFHCFIIPSNYKAAPRDRMNTLSVRSVVCVAETRVQYSWLVRDHLLILIPAQEWPRDAVLVVGM